MALGSVAIGGFGVAVLPVLCAFGFEAWKMGAHFRFLRPDQVSPTHTMKAVTYHTHGAASEVLRVESVAAPVTPAGPGLIVVRVAGAALNPVDFKMRRNPQPAMLIPLPKIPGYDVSGVVVSAGPGTPFAAGDAVFGMLPIIGNRWGSLAEYVVGDARAFAHAPKTVPLADAAALPLVGLTVLQVLDMAVGAALGARPPPPRGEPRRILVQAASGGVGSFAVQYARNVLRFDEVHATASASNADFVRSLGATHAYDYTAADGAALAARGMDVVIDPVAWRYMGATLQPGSHVLRDGGAYAHILSSDWASNDAESSPLLPFLGAFHRWSSALRSVLNPSTRRVFSSAVVPDALGLRRIAEYVDSGQVRPVIDKVFVGLDSAVDAFHHLETGHARGKVIVRPSEEEWWTSAPA